MATPQQFFSALESSEALPSIIGCGGAERVLIDDALKIIRKKALKGAMVEFNHDRVSAKEESANDIVNLARQLPTMAKRRLLEVHDSEDIEPNDTLLELLQNPLPETVVLFVYGSKCDVRRKFTKSLSKHGLFAKFDHPNENDMIRWTERRSKMRKLTLSHEATQAIALTVGNDIGLLDRALDKLELLAHDEEITLSLIEKHITNTSVQDAFALGRSVALGDRKSSLIALAKLERDRAAPIQLMGLLAWQLRLVTKARALLDENQGEAQIKKELRLFGANSGAVMRAARQYKLMQHERRLGRLADTDLALKSSAARPWLLMTDLVLRLCPAPKSEN